MTSRVTSKATNFGAIAGRYLRLAIASLAFLAPWTIQASEGDLEFVIHNLHLDKFDVHGFTAPAVTHSVLKDSRGRIWLGTEGGLYRYDGNEVREFVHEPDNPASVPNSFAKSLLEDNNGTIWVGTFGAGLAYFDEHKQEFQKADFSAVELIDDTLPFDEKVWGMAVDPDNNLWLGTFSSGLFRYDQTTHELTQIFIHTGAQRNHRIDSVFTDSTGRIWISVWPGAVKAFDPESLQVVADLDSAWHETIFHDIAELQDGTLVIASHSSLHLLDNNGLIAKTIEVTGPASNDQIMEVVPYEAGSVLVGTAGSGLWHVDLDSEQSTRIPHGKHQGAIEPSITWDMKLTDEGELLIGGTTGLWISHAPSRKFWTITGYQEGRPFFFTETRAIERLDGYLYLNSGTMIYRLPFDDLSGQIETVRGEVFAATAGHRPLWMEHGRDDAFWVGTDTQVFRVDRSGTVEAPEGLRGTHTMLVERDTGAVTHVTPWGLFELSRNNLPLSAEQKSMRMGESKAASKSPQTMAYGHHQDVWTGSFNGLERFSATTNQAIPAFTADAEKSSWPDPYVTFIKPTEENGLLIGSMDGIWHADLAEDGRIQRIVRAFSDQPFARTAFTSFVETGDGRLLLIGDVGLVDFSPADQTFRVLSTDEGFPTYDPYAAGFHQWNDGIAILSGNYGPLLFKPDEVQLASGSRDLVITDVVSFRGNAAIHWSWQTDSMKFEYSDRVIRFKFGVLDYLNPTNDRYSIRLAGFQNEWLDIGRLKEFSFTNLDAGEYRLDIRVDEGLTGKSSELSVPFTVLPPWWRTWWAYSLYVLFIFGSLFLYWLSLQRKIAREQEISARLREADRIKSHFLNELESKVEDATQDLRHAVEALEIKNIELGATQQRAVDASRLKSEFLANMSHEIRTPMNGVLGFTQLLQKSNLDNDQRDYVETIDKSAKSLLGIINDVLDVSKIEAGKLIIDSSGFDLRECVADTLQALAPVAYDKNLELIGHVDDSLPDGLRSDPTRLRQMLTNLVGNAIKFTDSGHVYVHVEKASSGDGEERLRISVSDTGRGISAEDREKLFHAFERGSVDLAGRYTGTGLGLVITKKLCEAMGGSVELDSVPGKGTQVVLELPLVVDRNPENRYGFGKPLKNRSIVIVDPHTQSREALRSRLAHWGADVTALADVVEPAMKDADLVIFGIERFRLGDTRGLEALQRKLPENVPGLCMAASVDRDALRSMAEACGAPCIPKVGHLESQLRRICEALGIGMDAAETEEATLARLTGLHVLVADDNRINRYFLKKILELHGARVTEADSGQGVLRMLDSLDGKIDIALLDVHMPDIDGLEVARRIRARGNHKLPLLAVSANVQTETHEAAIAAGINDYLLKPVEEMKLVEAVLEWTGREVVTTDE